MLTTKSERLLERGKVINLGIWSIPNYNSRHWIVYYRGKFYRVVHDGTGNGYFHHGDPVEISRERAIKYVLDNLGIEEGLAELKDKFNIELTDDEIDDILGL